MDQTTIDDIAKGTLIESGPDRIVLGIPFTEYQLYLVPVGSVIASKGSRASGRIDLNARRIDVCNTGGNFIDPLIGPPRNIVGRVLAHDPSSKVIVVHARVPLRVRVKPPQEVTQFPVGSLVTFAAEPGATFTPA